MHIYEKQDIIIGELNCMQLQSRLWTKTERKMKMKLQSIKIILTNFFIKKTCGILSYSGTL